MFFCTRIALAQNAEEYNVQKRLYTHADGLPGREVVCATQDNLGYMWFGLENGLCRFDGIKFDLFTQKKSGLRAKKIRQVFSDNAQGIIIVYETREESFSESEIRCANGIKTQLK